MNTTDPHRQVLVDIEALHAQCVRWEVEWHPMSSLDSAHRLLAKLPTAVARLGQLGDVVELQVVARRCFGSVWTCAVGGKTECQGSFENCVTKIAQHCIPPAKSEARAAIHG